MTWSKSDFLPRSLDSFVGIDHVVGFLKGYVRKAKEEGFRSLKNLAFVGPYGTGKTEIARVFAQEIFADETDDIIMDNKYKRFVAGDYSKKDFLDTIGDWFKFAYERILVFDEMQEMKPEIQALLAPRLSDPQYEPYVKVILIYNWLEKDGKPTIHENLRDSGRLRFVDFKIDDEDMRRIAEKVIEKKKVKITEERLNSMISEAKGNARGLIDALEDYDVYPEEAKKKVVRLDSVKDVDEELKKELGLDD